MADKPIHFIGDSFRCSAASPLSSKPALTEAQEAAILAALANRFGDTGDVGGMTLSEWLATNAAAATLEIWIDPDHES